MGKWKSWTCLIRLLLQAKMRAELNRANHMWFSLYFVAVNRLCPARLNLDFETSIIVSRKWVIGKKLENYKEHIIMVDKGVV